MSISTHHARSRKPILGHSRLEPASSPAVDRLNIALVITQRHWGGGEEQSRLLALGLRRLGHNCSILTRSNSEFARRMLEEGFSVHTFAGSGRSLQGIYSIRRHLKQLRPDVVHANDPHAVTAAGLASWGLSIPAKIAARHTSFPIRSPRRYRSLSDVLICVATNVASVCQDCGIPKEQIRVVHAGTDPNVARSGDRQRGRRALEVSDDQLVLLTVANLVDCKGHDILLEAMPAVISKYPKVCLALAGQGPLEAELKSTARRLGIEEHVRFLGFRNDVPDLIRAADLFVMPSLLEGICSVLIEVMLGGCPIVTTTAGGILDLVGDEIPVSWTIDPGDRTQLQGAILEALDHPEQRQVRQARALQRAESHFTDSQMVEGMLEVYREVLARRS